MLKTLSERIAKKMAANKPTPTAKNRAEFLARRSEIKQALDDGWPVKTIWSTLVDEGHITFGYQAFRGYVKRLILLATTAKLDRDETHPNTISSKTTIEKKLPAPVGFIFNPIARKEDLL